MGPVIGDVLPLALGIAISPIPIIAAILMLLSPKARATSIGFLVGWLLGVVVAVVAFTLLSAILPSIDPSVAHPIAGIIQLVMGVLLLLLTIRQLRKRPKKGAAPKLPKWMDAIDSMTAGRALVLAFLLAAANPKNLMMAVSAGLAIGAGELPTWQSIIVIVTFVIIAASTVLAPVVAYLIATDRMRAPLDAIRDWLTHNNSTIMAVLSLVMGVMVIGKGVGQF